MSREKVVGMVNLAQCFSCTTYLSNTAVVQQCSFGLLIQTKRSRVWISFRHVKSWASFFNLHCSSSFRCMNEYLVIGSGGYLHKQPLCINCSVAEYFPEELIWCLIEYQAVREVKCKGMDTVLYKNLPLLFNSNLETILQNMQTLQL